LLKISTVFTILSQVQAMRKHLEINFKGAFKMEELDSRNDGPSMSAVVVNTDDIMKLDEVQKRKIEIPSFDPFNPYPQE